MRVNFYNDYNVIQMLMELQRNSCLIWFSALLGPVNLSAAHLSTLLIDLDVTLSESETQKERELIRPNRIKMWPIVKLRPQG